MSQAPQLPAGFTDTFTGRYVDAGELRLHAVIAGDGPPLLLVHGWPQSWYAWRLLMPALARDFEVIAVDQRGMGLSDKPAGGYDACTLAGDLIDRRLYPEVARTIRSAAAAPGVQTDSATWIEDEIYRHIKSVHPSPRTPTSSALPYDNR